MTPYYDRDLGQHWLGQWITRNNVDLSSKGIYDIHLRATSREALLKLIRNTGDYTYHITYRKVSNIRRTLVGNKIVDHSDVVGASPAGAAPTTSSFST